MKREQFAVFDHESLVVGDLKVSQRSDITHRPSDTESCVLSEEKPSELHSTHCKLITEDEA